MRRVIRLEEKQHEVTLRGDRGNRRVQVEDGAPFPAELVTGRGTGAQIIRVGEAEVPVTLAARGETVYIRAFDRTFTLYVVDPVEQAVQETGGGANTVRAPMPGVVVEVRAASGDRVVQGQAIMVIESMKILTVVAAPRDGVVEGMHFEPGSSFGKNAVLATLR